MSLTEASDLGPASTDHNRDREADDDEREGQMKIDPGDHVDEREEQHRAELLPNRLPDAGQVAGVAAGLSQRFGVDVQWVRLAFVLLTFASGVGPIGYGLLWLAMKPEGQSTVSFRPRDAMLAVAAALLVSVVLALVLAT